MIMMNSVYDNGEIMLGTKRNIVAQIHNYMLTDENDETYMELLEDMKDYKDDDILSVNYEYGMGPLIHCWTEEDRLEID